MKSGRIYQASQQESGGFVCSCYVNSSFRIACRHVLFLRQERHENVFNLTDFLPRWHRGNQSATSKFDVFDDVARAAFDGVPDENVLDDEGENAPVDSSFRYVQRGVRFKTVCDRSKLFASVMSNFGAKEFKERLLALDNFIEIIERGEVRLISLPDKCDVATSMEDMQVRTCEVMLLSLISVTFQV